MEDIPFDSDLAIKSRMLELEGLIVVPALIYPAEVGAEPLSVGAVSVPPAVSSFLCFWPQAAVCYLFFNLVAWSDPNSVRGWNNRQIRKISYLGQRLVYIKGYPLCQFEYKE